MTLEERKERYIKSIEKAVDELDKLINQEIDLVEPEKAKTAAQGKLEAIKGTKELLDTLQELSGEEVKVVEKKKAGGLSPEARINR